MATPPRRRPVVGSRHATSRPRKVAGQSGAPVAEPVESVEAAEPMEPVEPAEPIETFEAVEPAEPIETFEAVEPPREPHHHRLLGSLGTTVALVVAIVLLVGLAAGEGWYLWLRDGPAVSADRPVVTGKIAYRAAVDAASQDTEDILSTSYKNYDDQVAQATGKMTPSFAKQYRSTVGDIRQQFLASKTELQVSVVASSVVQASSEQVQALLFLNQYVTRAGKHTAFTPYRALVTVVHTQHGWLVSAIDTQ